MNVANRLRDNAVLSDWSGDWDDSETSDAFEASEVSSRRSRAWIIWTIAGVAFLLLVWYVWVAALTNPDNYRVPVDFSSPWQGAESQVGNEGSERSAWLARWIVGHVLLQVVGLVLIARRRHRMSTRLIVKWSLLVLFVPIAGVLGFYFYLLEGVVQRGVPGRQEETASFLRSPRQGM